MKRIAALALAVILSLSISGCYQKADGDGMTGDLGYTQISQEEAEQMMLEEEDGHAVVDVRSWEEYETSHIPGAICVPNESIGEEMPSQLPDPNQIILVYCRSGRRSKEAAQKLAGLGYSRIFEFGGIQDWTGEAVSGDSSR